MATLRQLYFEALKKESTYLTENVIRFLLTKVNNITTQDFTLKMDNECKDEKLFWNMVKEVENGKPYQYVIHSAEFCGHDFYVDENVLIPRFETEELVKKTIELIKSRDTLSILDVCTGSGCIAISLAKEFPTAKVVATDISKNALEVAKKNSENLNADVTFFKGNIVDPILAENERYDVLICNPPYIKSEETVDKMVLEHEPHLALFAKPNTKFYQEIFLAAPCFMNDGGLLAFEIDDDMEESLSLLIKKTIPLSTYRFEKDMYGHTRFLFINYVEDKRNDIYKAAEILRSGGIACFPTETVMGLGVIFDNYNSYIRLNVIKDRPDDKPYTVMLDSYEKVEKYACISIRFKKIVEKCADYPMTFLLNKKDIVPGFVTHDTKVIGVRVPNHPMIRKLIQLVGKPLLVPSANKSGNKPAINSNEAQDIFGNEVDYYLHGECVGGTPSTIIDLTNKGIKIIREGDLTLEEINRRLNDEH